MSKLRFSNKDVELLSKNEYVKKVSNKSITYTYEFKEKAVKENINGKPARYIFEDSGFNVNIIGMSRVDSALTRWKASYNKNGLDGLLDTRTTNSGRNLERTLTLEEQLNRTNAENEFLKAQVELLKKIRLLGEEL